MTRAVIQAAEALLDAYCGGYPAPWLLQEANALAQALAVHKAEAEPVNHHVAAVEHLRSAQAHVRAIGEPRLARRIADAVDDVVRSYARQVLPHDAEVLREAYRQAGLPDPVGGDDGQG